MSYFGWCHPIAHALVTSKCRSGNRRSIERMIKPSLSVPLHDH
jgi:hypothetical protein